jgi:hypothetical protein
MQGTSLCSAQKISDERGDFADIPVAILASPAVTDCGFKSLFLQLTRLGVRVEDHLPKLALQQENDICLTEFFLQAQPPQDTLRDLLQCCQSLGVHWLLDLATADGLAIRPSACAGKQITHQFPTETCPSTVASISPLEQMASWTEISSCETR